MYQTSRFEFQNGFENISGTAQLYSMFLYAKRTEGPPISAHIKHRNVAFIRAEI